MNKGVLNLAALLAVACAMSVGCGTDDDSSPSGAGTGGKGGSSGSAGKGGKGGSAGKGGSSGSAGAAGSPSGGAPSGGEGPNGGRAGSGEAGTAQAGAESAGAAGREESGGEAGMGQGGASGAGAGGEAGAGGFTSAQVARGQLLVRSVALCGGCHTATNGSELAGNAAFAGGNLPAPNLTPDATGLGEWTDAQIINAIRNGIDDENRQLNSAMPYWLFHNMTDDDATSIVAFLRSLPPVAASIGATNPAATAVAPLSPAAFPVTSLPTSDPNYAKAQKGQYLLSGVAQCVKCHSPAAPGVPTANFFSGATPPVPVKIFASNITPDVTGIGGWTAQDVATALKLGVNKANVALCGAMPSGSASAPTKGYGGLSDEDALAIGVYLTTIPAVSNAASAPSLEPACP